MDQQDLAKALGVSRGYLSLLESSEEKDPSLAFLRKAADVLIRSGATELSSHQLRDAASLGLAAIGVPYADPFVGVLGTVEDEVDAQREEHVTSVWIVSETLGENIYPPLLEATVFNLRRGVTYTYFVPKRSSEWDVCLRFIKHQMAEDEPLPAHLLEDRMTAISCPPLMCSTRIRVINPLQSNMQATISLGSPLKDLILYKLEPAQAERIVKSLAHVINGTSVESPFESDDGRFELMFGKKKRGHA